MSRLFGDSILRAYDANGDPVPGALLTAYIAGTSTEVTTYGDAALTTPQASPVEADAAGVFPQVYVPVGSYKMRITTAAGAEIPGGVVDNIVLGIDVLSMTVEQYPTRGAAAAAYIPSDITSLHVMGYSAPGDGGAAIYAYNSAGALVSHDGKFQDANGRWFVLAETYATPQMLGAVGGANEGAATEAAVGTDDSAAMLKAIRYCEATNRTLLLTSKYRIDATEIFIRKPILIAGIGAGAGYSETALTDYEMVSGFVFTGAGPARVRTRVNHRASSSDPQDDPLSAGLCVQAENVTLRDFACYLWFDREDDDPTNYGADWDVGIFNGCRVHLSLTNIHIVGYWREACYWGDVTRSSSMLEFNDPDGNAYDAGHVASGADGLTMTKVFFRGGKWAVRIQGAKPAAGETDYGPDYYDELSGTLVDDYRGTFGHSDFTATASSFYGTDHHSNRRRDDASGNYLTDTAGGSVYIDGMANNASGCLQGMRFFSCRFATFEPYRVRLGRCNRATFYGHHMETRANFSRLDAGGDPLEFDATDTYGMISTESTTQSVLCIGGNTSLLGSFYPSFIADMGEIQDLFSAGSGETSRTSHRFEASIFASTGELDLRSAEGAGIRLRDGNDTVGLINEDELSPGVDNSQTGGTASRRYQQVYAVTSTIGTSDAREKQDVEALNAAEMRVAVGLKGLVRRYRWQDAVSRKGADARFHVGVMAQDVIAAFEAEGLDATRYGVVCRDEWTDDEGVLRDRYGVRYDELFAFILAGF